MWKMIALASTVIHVAAAPVLPTELASIRFGVEDRVANEGLTRAGALDLSKLSDRFERRLDALELLLEVRHERAGGAVHVTGTLTDLRSADRAVDLVAEMPLPPADWQWHHDINRAVAITSETKLTEHQYPLVVLTSPSREVGLCACVAPSQPFIYEFEASAEGLRLRARFGLTQDAPDALKGKAPFEFWLFPVDAQWGFRDALQTYYRMFPDDFRRRCLAEGMWLFAFPASRLPNPAHYAFHEGGPGGWEFDDEHGILTMPYREVSSRTISLPVLPKDRAEALVMWEEYKRTKRTTLADWHARTAQADDRHAHGGKRSLFCEKADAGGWVGANQDVRLAEPKPTKVEISGWSKAEAVTGATDREYALWADVLLSNGDWLFGQTVSFNVGTHDWERASRVIESTTPIAMVRLHVLFRSGHQGKVWFDDIAVVRPDRPNENLCSNAGFEDDAPNETARMIDEFALEAADGGPIFRIATDFSSDVKPTTPYKLLRFTCNPSPYLRSLTDSGPSVGEQCLQHYEKMFAMTPGIDGAYIDSVSAWATPRVNFRREHFLCSRNPFTYDPKTLRVVAHGRYYTQDFLRELGKRLHPQGRYVFTNIHNTMETFHLYTVSDVPGIESSVSNHERFAYIRSAAARKPAVLLNFLNLGGFGERSKQEAHWRRSLLYALYPSIGRRCDEAFVEFNDLYEQFMPAIKTLSAAGWHPVTLATAPDETVKIERYGSYEEGTLHLAALNESNEALRLIALGGLSRPEQGRVALDILSGDLSPADGNLAVRLPPAEATAIHLGAAADIAKSRKKDLAENSLHIRRSLAQATGEDRQAAEELLALAEAIATGESRAMGEAELRTLAKLSSTQFAPDTWTGERLWEAILRAIRDAHRASAPIGLKAAHMELPEALVAGDIAKGRVVLSPKDSDSKPQGWLLVRDGEGLRVIEPIVFKSEGASLSSSFEIAPVTKGFEGDKAEILALISTAGLHAALSRVVPLRAVIELQTHVKPASMPTAARRIGVQVRNNSSRPQEVKVRLDLPWENWRCEPPSQTLNCSPHSAAEATFRVVAPPARIGAVHAIRCIATGNGNDEAVCETSGLFVPFERLATNLAREEGVTVEVDSCFGSYDSEPLNDGRLWPPGVHWTDYSWASAETQDPHWIQISFREPCQVGRVSIFWDASDYAQHGSRSFRIQVHEQDAWRDVAVLADQPPHAAIETRFDPVVTRAVRIHQDGGAGCSQRPNLMWVSEVEIGP